MTSGAQAKVAKMRGEAVVTDHPMREDVAERDKDWRSARGLNNKRATQMYKDLAGVDLKPFVFETEDGKLYQLQPYVKLMLMQKGEEHGN